MLSPFIKKFIKKQLILSIVLFAIAIVAGYVWYAYQSSSEIPPINNHQARCFQESETVDFKMDINEHGYGDATFIIKDKYTGVENLRFVVDHVFPNHYREPERYRCGIYLIRIFDFDFKKFVKLSAYNIGLWQYDYAGEGKEVVLFSGQRKGGAQVLPRYGFDFRVDPTEKYLVLIKESLGSAEYALVVKDLITTQDIFSSRLGDMLAQYPGIKPGSFDLGKWSQDGRYLKGSIYDGAYDTAYYRLERDTWKFEVFPTPSDLPSGAERAVSFGGYLAYSDITSFTGDADMDAQIEENARQSGRKENLWLYSFWTKQKTKIASVDDPSWVFKLNWLSDIELEYYIPPAPGIRKVYTITSN